jgi:hypothetical protein
MSTLVSIRFDVKTHRAVKHLARVRGITQSQVVRSAVEYFLKEENPEDLQEVWGQVVGCVSGGPADLSENTGKRFIKLIEKRKGRS